jgi:hypothetical protein
MSKFIVISGKKQSGKTTSAKYIKNEIQACRPEAMVEITSFASPIKEFCTDVLGLTKTQVYGTEEEKNSPTHIKWDTMPSEIRVRYGKPFDPEKNPEYKLLYQALGMNKNLMVPIKGPMTAREVMQILGTDIFRNFFDYDIWAKAPFNKNYGFTDFVIIDDCRFHNEADMALKHDATLIRLTRDVLGADQHISEKAMDDYPIQKYNDVIDNQKYTDIKELFKDLNIIINKLI